MSVYSKLQSLLTAANTLTGESDVTLTDGVQHLKNGFMQRIVYFYDYDGTLLSSQHIASIEAMPTPPAHEDLTFVRWSQTLDAIQASQDDTYAYAVFRPSDGKTRIYMSFTSSTTNPTLYFSQDKSNGVEIDWGDGSQPERVSGSGVVTVTHTYSSQGSYMITLTPDSDCTWSPGSGTSTTANSFVSSSTRDYVTKIVLGDRCATIPQNAFYGIPLEILVIPDTVSAVSASGLNKIRVIIFPSSTASYTLGGAQTFDSNKTIKYVFFPATATVNYGDWCFSNSTIEKIVPWYGSVGVGAFNRCDRLTGKIQGLGNPGDRTFARCNSVAEFVVGKTSAPTISVNSRAFEECSQSCSITIYTMPQYVSSILANTRNGAVNATIIIKAANDTVYEGVSYAAGETMLTSNP